jgi:protein CpxP
MEMIKTRRIVLATAAVAALLGFGQMAWAVDAAAPKAEEKKPMPAMKKKAYDPKKSFEKFSKKLNLTAEQKEKIRPILNDEVKQIKEMYKETKDKEMKVIDDTHAKVNAILTPEQQKKYAEMIAKRKAEFKKRHGMHGKMSGECGDKSEMKDKMESPAKMESPEKVDK